MVEQTSAPCQHVSHRRTEHESRAQSDKFSNGQAEIRKLTTTLTKKNEKTSLKTWQKPKFLQQGVLPHNELALLRVTWRPVLCLSVSDDEVVRRRRWGATITWSASYRNPQLLCATGEGGTRKWKTQKKKNLPKCHKTETLPNVSWVCLNRMSL